MLTFIICTALGFDAGISSVMAEEKKNDGKKEMSLREKYALPSHIQLTPMMVPIRHAYQSTSAITIFLEPVKRQTTGKICHHVPRIRDAILRILSREPIPTRRNRLVLEGVAEKLIRFINIALDKEKIKNAIVEPGMVNLAGSSSGLSRLPFATINGCRGIKEIEEKLEAAEKKAKEQK
jgi:hypothetical protein